MDHASGSKLHPGNVSADERSEIVRRELGMKMTICCLEPVLAPYSAPRFKALQSLRPDYSVRVMALGATERMREWTVRKHDLGFDYVEAVPGETVEDINPHTLVARVGQWLDESDPQAVVITGYYYSAMRAAARWARRHRRASIYLGDSQWADRPRIVLREWLKGWWVRRHYDSAFVAGERAATYLTKMGFHRERIWTGYDVVDNQAFYDGAQSARADADRLRTSLGIPKRYFLYVGRFAPEKNVLRLLDAYGRYRRESGSPSWGLVLVGSGPQEAQLRTVAQSLRDVVFTGFQQLDKIPAYFGLASCLVLPSLSEPWGLVVNEALAAGLPVIVSHRCGCVPELVRSGLNGYVCDPFDIDGLARLMAVMSSGRVDVHAMSKASRELVAMYTPETWAQTFNDCIQLTLAGKRREIDINALEVSRKAIDLGSSSADFPRRA
jgi:glycosyltransferase involved in cell wall biosynthesis